MQRYSKYPVLFVLCILVVAGAAFGKVPQPVQDRFVIGEPVWKEIDVREELGSNYTRCWQKLVDIVTDKGFEIGFMEEPSGYIRTNSNAGIVRLKGAWVYEIKFVVKLVLKDESLETDSKSVDKIRLQVLGNLAKVKKGVIKESYSGYDRIVLQDLFNDLQQVFGRQ